MMAALKDPELNLLLWKQQIYNHMQNNSLSKETENLMNRVYNNKGERTLGFPEEPGIKLHIRCPQPSDSVQER